MSCGSREENLNNLDAGITQGQSSEMNITVEKCDIIETSVENTDDGFGKRQIYNNNAPKDVVEEENFKNVESDRLETCTSPNIKPTENTKETTKPADLLLQSTLIHKVNEMDISGKVNKNATNNKSTVILKKENDSLKNLMVYDNSSDDTDEEDFEKNWQLHTIASDSSDSESDSDGSLESSSDSDTDDVSDTIFSESNKGAIKKDTPKSGNILKTAGEMDIPDLPPVPDLSSLKIDVEKEEFLHMGNVQAIIDVLVTVEAIPGTPAYDIDSYLFIEDKTTKRPLGAVYDVIGPVTAPIYCIRFNTAKEIQELNVKPGLKVFSAPKSQYTQYVFVKELLKIKGSDASWVGDQEVPPEMVEISDEEEDEHNLQNARKAQKRKHGSLERHKEFEKSMNRCNTLNTRVAQLVDAHRRLPRPIRYDSPQRSLGNDFRSCINRVPAPFDPSVPPPGFHDYSRLNSMPNVRPPVQWSWMPQEVFRPPHGHPNAAPFRHSQNNSANYYTNNPGRNHAAGPSSQPF